MMTSIFFLNKHKKTFLACGMLTLAGHPDALSCLLLNGIVLENTMKKLIGLEKGREIIYQLSSQAKQDYMGKINFIYCQLQ